MMEAAPPGWYPQPDGTRLYWDGQEWAPPPPPPTQPPGYRPPTPMPIPQNGRKRPPAALGCVTLLVLLALTVGAVALVTGRGSGDDAATWRVQALGQGPSQDTGQPISDAICNDLGPNGLSGFQLKASTQETTAMSGEEFAEYLYGHLAVGCPALLQDESIRNFLTQWGVNPDA